VLITVSADTARPHATDPTTSLGDGTAESSQAPTRRDTARPRILMVSANAYPIMGGVETHIYEVAPRLVRAGFDVTILTTDRTGGLPKEEMWEGATIKRVRAWPGGTDYYFAPGILNVVRKGQWDLVHCQGYHTFVPIIAMAASLTAHLPYVVTFHSGGHGSQVRTRLRPMQQLILRPLLAKAARLIAVADFERRFFSKQLRIADRRFVVIPNGGELSLPAGVDSSEDPSLIVSVGRLEKYKGHHRVMAAIPHLQETIPGVRLRIVGAGPYEEELRRLARSLGIENRVEIGSVPPTERHMMAELLSKAGLVTLLSDYEAHPVAVTEAIAMGRRVLVADTSGLSEIADRGHATAIPLSSSPTEIAAAILAALASPPPPKVDIPTWDACAELLGATYTTVLAR
jgi:glycosyltransferase involved in cell wall biosynthesis